MEGSNYSLSDIAAVGGGNGMFGGNNAFAYLILFALIFGWGGNFNRGGEYGQYATAASQQEILFNQHFNNLDNKMDRGFTSIGNGIADATFALNNTIVSESRGLNDKLYDVKSALHAEGEATRAMIQQNKIETLQGRINQLELQAAMCGVVKYPNQMTFNAGGSPFCNYGNCCGYNNI